MLKKKIVIFIGVFVVIIFMIFGTWRWIDFESHPFPLVSGEKISLWDFTSAYAKNEDLTKQVDIEIKRLEGLIGSEEFSDYELYVSIANQYELLGDGKQAYIFLGKALMIDTENTGLAWHNIGKLLERLEAIQSAKRAYDAMVTAQASLYYQNVRLNFLRVHIPENLFAIQEAETLLRNTYGEFAID